MRVENGGVAMILVARYLAQATREKIIASGAGYIDATGNLLSRVRFPSTAAA